MAAVDLAYGEWGSPDAPPLIILHGFLASARNWKWIAEQLADSHRVFALDQRNHGASPHHPQMDYPALAADVKHFIARHGLRRVSLLGHSMGGKAAMWLALNDPAGIDKLIVGDIAPVGYTHSFDAIFAALKQLPLAALGNRKQAEEQLQGGIPDLSYRQFLLQNLVLEDGHYRWRVDLDICARAAPHIIGFPETGALAPYRGPALFLAGAESNLVRAETVLPLFPGARIQTLEKAGHWLHAQQPRRFIEAVRDFLAA